MVWGSHHCQIIVNTTVLRSHHAQIIENIVVFEMRSCRIIVNIVFLFDQGHENIENNMVS